MISFLFCIIFTCNNFISLAFADEGCTLTNPSTEKVNFESKDAIEDTIKKLDEEQPKNLILYCQESPTDASKDALYIVRVKKISKARSILHKGKRFLLTVESLEKKKKYSMSVKDFTNEGVLSLAQNLIRKKFGKDQNKECMNLNLSIEQIISRVESNLAVNTEKQIRLFQLKEYLSMIPNCDESVHLRIDEALTGLLKENDMEGARRDQNRFNMLDKGSIPKNKQLEEVVLKWLSVNNLNVIQSYQVIAKKRHLTEDKTQKRKTLTTKENDQYVIEMTIYLKDPKKKKSYPARLKLSCSTRIDQCTHELTYPKELK